METLILAEVEKDMNWFHCLTCDLNVLLFFPGIYTDQASLSDPLIGQFTPILFSFGKTNLLLF
jgi:hypothetical protein